MSEAKTRPRRMNPIALSMKAVGYLTSPETLPGKAFTAYERLLTRALDRLGRSEAYLDVSGKVMKAGFAARRETVSATEAWLRLLRLPTASDVSELRRELRAVHDEVEALGAQLEVVVEALERRSERPSPSAGRGALLPAEASLAGDVQAAEAAVPRGGAKGGVG